MPDVLHFLVPCIRLLPSNIDLCFVLNGAREWEADYLLKKFPTIQHVQLCCWLNVPLIHGEVVDLLLDSNDHDFGIIDHNLYVFSSALFDGLTFGEQDFLIGLYPSKNPLISIDYPTTHFLYLNSQRINAIRECYDIHASTRRQLSGPARVELAKIGLAGGRYLKASLNYFDTLNAVMALGQADGYKIKYLDPEKMHAVHLGGTSGVGLLNLSSVLAYAGLRFLERSDAVIQQEYRKLYDNYGNVDTLKHYILTTKAQFLTSVEAIDRLMDRIEEKLV